MLGLYLKGSVWEHPRGGANFRDATGIAINCFVCQDRTVFQGHSSSRPKSGSREVMVNHGLFLFVPRDDGFASIRAIVDRMRYADSLAVQRPFPASDIDRRFVRLGVFELSLP